MQHPLSCCCPDFLHLRSGQKMCKSITSVLFVLASANKGIGLEIARGLANAGFFVFLAARDIARGQAAEASLKANELAGAVHFLQLDVTNEDSLTAAVAHVKQHGGLDVLVVREICNAGVASKGSDISSQIARNTCAVNYFGVKSCVQAFDDALRDGARVVVVGSRMGDYHKLTPPRRAEFCAQTLTLPQLDALVHGFEASIDGGTAAEWMTTPNTYAFSKIAVNSLTAVLARHATRGISIVAMCPGWIRTDMGGANASKTAVEGADTAVFLATTDTLLQPGKFYADRAVLEAFSPLVL